MHHRLVVAFKLADQVLYAWQVLMHTVVLATKSLLQER